MGWPLVPELVGGEPLSEAIRLLLCMEWDPLGTQRSGEPWGDQFDAYVRTVYRMAVDSSSAEDIAAYLGFVESGLMARLSPPGTTLAVAKMALKLAAAARRGQLTS